MKGIIEKVDKANKKITINGKEYQIGKKVWNRENLENKLDSGIEIEYDIKGSNFDFKKISTVSAYDNNRKNNKTNNNNNINSKKVHKYPYNFISFDENIKRNKRKIGKHSGSISLKIKTLTPTSVEEIDRGKYAIQGSSLKGMFRTLVESLTNSCFKNFHEKKYREFGGQKNYNSLFPKELNACDDYEKICYACNMFGTTDLKRKIEKDGKIKEVNQAVSSKLFFSDAIVPKEINVSKKILQPLLTPHAELDKYYIRNNKLAGRKVFFHHDDKLNCKIYEMGNKVFANIKKDVNSEVFIVDTGIEIELKMDFKNLTDIEFGILLFIIGAKNKEFIYKIGRGKPLGLGSIKININQIAMVEDKYSGFLPSTKTLENDKITKYINCFLEEFEDIRKTIIKEVKETLTKKIDFSKGAYNRQNNMGIKIKHLANILDL